MYKCTDCGNSEEFHEKYYYTKRIYLQDGEPVKVEETDHEIVEIVCPKCNGSTENEAIKNKENEIIIIDIKPE